MINIVCMTGVVITENNVMKIGKNGKKYINFCISHAASTKTKRNLFHCYAFDEIAETLEKYAVKNNVITIVGDLQVLKKKKMTIIVVRQFDCFSAQKIENRTYDVSDTLGIETNEDEEISEDEYGGIIIG